MLKTSRCVLVTILGMVLVFGCDPSAMQICNSKSVRIAHDITDRLMEILSKTTKLDYLKVFLCGFCVEVIHFRCAFGF